MAKGGGGVRGSGTGMRSQDVVVTSGGTPIARGTSGKVQRMNDQLRQLNRRLATENLTPAQRRTVQNRIIALERSMWGPG